MSSYSIAYDIFANDKGFTSTVRGMQGTFKDFRNNVGKNFQDVQQQFANFKNVGKGVADFGKSWALKISAPTAAFTTFSLKAFMDLEKVRNKFTTFFGKEAPEAMQFTQKYAQNTAYGFQEVAEMMNMFKRQQKAFSLTDTGVTGATKGVGDVLLAYSDTQDDRERAMKAISQIGMATHMNLGDVHQLTNAQIPILDMLQRSMGKTGPEIFKMIRDGQVTSKMILETLLNESKTDQIKQLLDLRSKSLGQAWDSLTENFTLFRAGWGEMLSETLGLPEGFKTMTSVIQQMTIAIKEASPMTKNILAWGTIFLMAVPPLSMLIWTFMKLRAAMNMGKTLLFGQKIANEAKMAASGISKAAHQAELDWLKITGGTQKVRQSINKTQLAMGMLSAAMLASQIASTNWGEKLKALQTDGIFTSIVKNVDVIVMGIEGLIVAQTAFNTAALANPYVRIALGIAALGGLIYEASQREANDPKKNKILNAGRAELGLAPVGIPSDWKKGTTSVPTSAPTQAPTNVDVKVENYFTEGQKPKTKVTTQTRDPNAGLMTQINNSYGTVGFAGVMD